MAVCIVCGRFDETDLRSALNYGWVFLRCPECQRGIPFDIIAGHMVKRGKEALVQGFCPDHWFRDTGICAYCRAKRTGPNAGQTGQQQYSQYAQGDTSDAVA
ncbi:MAG: hypothetical protein ABI361_09825 [Nitrososphaera sp.]